MNLRKRNCGINMKIVPCGYGWTNVYLTIEGDEHYFVISNVVENQFDDLLRILYHLYPDNIEDEKGMTDIECKIACFDLL